MSPLDTLPWEGMGGYGMGYPTKYTTPFRAVLIFIIINLRNTFRSIFFYYLYLILIIKRILNIS